MPVPDKIGRYRVVRRIGSGAFATVWLGADDTLDASVAIKVLADNWSYHPDLRLRFEQEARILRRADSNLLVRVLDVGELPDGRPYLVMPYAAGGTLADRLAAGPLPVGEALRIAIDIAGAVTTLHEAGVLHRDLKPSNVLFQPRPGRDHVLVADLGLAKALANASGFTIIAGTPGYMPPEQATMGGGLDVRADVYAIGATLFHMLTGSLAERGKTRPSRLRAAVPSIVDDVVRRALHQDPKQRWPTSAALAEELRRVAASIERRRDRSHIRRLLARLASAALVLASVLAVTASDAVPHRAGWVRVTDATGALSVAVPPAWAGQVRDAGWNPPGLGHVPALVVAPALARWSDPTSPMPGVFVGFLTGAAPTWLPTHNECGSAQPDRAVRTNGATALVQRWSGCPGTVSYSEVLLADRGVYVQIKQVGSVDRADDILAGLRVYS